jgi:hypothetical protein
MELSAASANRTHSDFFRSYPFSKEELRGIQKKIFSANEEKLFAVIRALEINGLDNPLDFFQFIHINPESNVNIPCQSWLSIEKHSLSPYNHIGD